MAEGLAVAGSAVGIASLAIQLVNTVRELKSFVGDVKNAPQDLAEMLEHVDTLGEMIQDIAAEEQEHPNIFAKNRYLRKCLTQCDREVRAVSTFLENLAESVKRSRLRGSLRTVFRTRDVQKLIIKLEKAQGSLMFAYQIYINSLNKDMHRDGTRIIIAEVRKVHLAVQSQASASSSDGSFTPVKMEQRSVVSIPQPAEPSFLSVASAPSQDHNLRDYTCEKKESRISKFRYARTTYRLHIPIWFTSRLWEIQLHHSQRGWDNKIRTYNIIPPSSPIFWYCREHDVEAVMYLFQQGQASPFDRSPDGRTLLQWANLHEPEADKDEVWLELCRYLIDAGVEASNQDRNGLTIASTFWYSRVDPRPVYLSLWEILATTTDIDITGSSDLNLHSLVDCDYSSSEVIMAIRRYMYPPLESRSYAERVKFAIAGKYEAFRGESNWDMLRARLGCDPMDATFLRAIIPDHGLIAAYLKVIARILSIIEQIGSAEIVSQLWKIVAIAAEHGVNLQEEEHTSHKGMTAMHAFMQHYLDIATQSLRVESLQPADLRLWVEKTAKKAVRVWIGGLVASDIDMHGFTMRERAATDFRYTFEGTNDQYSGLGSCTTIDMSCGVQAADWDMEFSWRLNDWDIPEELATQFWHMLEHPAQVMPGAWQEEWDEQEVATYHGQRSKPSRHWMRKRASMIAIATWPDRWDDWQNVWCKKHILINPCERCVSKKLCSEHGVLECRLCRVRQCRQHVRISPCLRCANWCKFHFDERPCWECEWRTAHKTWRW